MCKQNNPEAPSSQTGTFQAVISNYEPNPVEVITQYARDRFATVRAFGVPTIIDTQTGQLIDQNTVDHLCNELLAQALSANQDDYTLDRNFSNWGTDAFTLNSISTVVVNWSLSSKVRNKNAHSYNGNTTPDLSIFRPGAEFDAQSIVEVLRGLADGELTGKQAVDRLTSDQEQIFEDFEHEDQEMQLSPEDRKFYADRMAAYNQARIEASKILKNGGVRPKALTINNHPIPLSGKKRNKLAHSYNGNPSRRRKQPKVPKRLRVRKQPKQKRSTTTAGGRQTKRTMVASTATEVRSTNHAPVRLRGREMCTTVGPPATYTANDFKPFAQPVVVTTPPTGFNALINPGNSDMFPQLSQEVSVYDKFKIRKLKFSYVSNTATSTNGVIQMAIDYDSYDQSTTGVLYTMRDLALLEGACSETVWDPRALVLTYTPRMDDKRWFYVTEAGQTGAKAPPLRDTYPGVLQCYGSTSLAAGAILGQLWVEYDIEFIGRKKPIPPSAAAVQWAVAGVPTSTATIFSTPTYAVANSGDFAITAPNRLSFFRAGRYAIHARQVGTVITGDIVIDVGVATEGSITAVTLVDGTTVHKGISNGSLTSHSYGVYDVALPSTGGSADIRFSLGAATTFTGSYVSVHGVHDSFAEHEPLTLEQRLSKLEKTQPLDYSLCQSEDECKLSDSVLLKTVTARLTGK